MATATTQFIEGPAWSKPGLDVVACRFPLRVETHVSRMVTRLLPGVITVTPHARYFGLHPLVYSEIRKRDMDYRADGPEFMLLATPFALLAGAIGGWLGGKLGARLNGEPRSVRAANIPRAGSVAVLSGLLVLIAVPALAHEIGGRRGEGTIVWSPRVPEAGQSIELQISDLSLDSGDEVKQVQIEARRAEHRVVVPLTAGIHFARAPGGRVALAGSSGWAARPGRVPQTGTRRTSNTLPTTSSRSVVTIPPGARPFLARRDRPR